jgi:hypothetical protein
MRKWLILLSALSVTAASGAQGFGAPIRSAAAPASTPATPSSQGTAAGPGYRSINVVSPTEQETLWNIGTMLNVRVALDPPLQPGHRIDLVLDGQRRNLNTASLQNTLPDVFRGAHTLVVVVLDDAGAEITRSPARTFFVQQTSVQNPNSIAGRQRAASSGK